MHSNVLVRCSLYSHAQQTQGIGDRISDFFENPGAHLPSLPQGVVDAAAGFGDGASFGLTDVVRDALDINGVVNQDSAAFNISNVAGALTTGSAATLRGAAFLGKVGGGTRFGHFINHNRFLRIGPGRMPANGSLPAGAKVPRLSIGRGPGNPHVDVRVRPID